jgi:hypothetical protein
LKQASLDVAEGKAENYMVIWHFSQIFMFSLHNERGEIACLELHMIMNFFIDNNEMMASL